MNHEIKLTRKERFQGVLIAVIGLTLWILTIGSLLELGANN